MKLLSQDKEELLFRIEEGRMECREIKETLRKEIECERQQVAELMLKLEEKQKEDYEKWNLDLTQEKTSREAKEKEMENEIEKLRGRIESV